MATSRPLPRVRAASLHRYVDLATELGLDPDALLTEHGLTREMVSSQDRWLPQSAVARLLGASASRCGRPDFGLLLSELRRFSTMGPLSMVLPEEPDLGAALMLFQRYLRTVNEGVRLRFVDGPGGTAMEISLDLPGVDESGHRQAIELTVAVMHGLVRELIGPAWRASEVRLPHDAPRDTATHERVFDARLVWGSPSAAIVLGPQDLLSPMAGHDPKRREYAHRFLGSFGVVGGIDDGYDAAVRRTIIERIRTGDCTVETVARDHGVDRRTLLRRLAGEGLTYRDLYDEARATMAEDLLANPARSVTEVSEVLGFAAPSGLTRWFRRRYACTPSEWRSRARDPS